MGTCTFPKNIDPSPSDEEALTNSSLVVIHTMDGSGDATLYHCEYSPPDSAPPRSNNKQEGVDPLVLSHYGGGLTTRKR